MSGSCQHYVSKSHSVIGAGAERVVDAALVGAAKVALVGAVMVAHPCRPSHLHRIYHRLYVVHLVHVQVLHRAYFPKRVHAFRSLSIPRELVWPTLHYLKMLPQPLRFLSRIMRAIHRVSIKRGLHLHLRVRAQAHFLCS